MAHKGARCDLSAEYVRSILDYEPETGVLRWKVRRGGRGKAGHIAGKMNKKGYVYISIDGVAYLSTRLSHLIEHGEWPKGRCAVCHKIFETSTVSAVYCSRDCRLAAARARDNERAPHERDRRNAYATQYRINFPHRVKAAIDRGRATPEGAARKKVSDAVWHAANRERANAKTAENYYDKRQRAPWMSLLHAAKARAKARGMPFDLTEKWAKSRWSGYCELSGIPFLIGNRGNTGHVYAPSIDKIDPAGGYTQSNCRFILFAINAFKHNGTDEDVYCISEAIIRYRAQTQEEEAAE